MNTQQLENFVTVAERRSVTRAAEELFVAQPALSQQIKTLEKEVGAKLFIRKPRSVELTEAGRVYYEMAKHMLLLERNMETEISNISSGNSGVLKLGTTPFYLDAFFSRLLRHYSEAHPGVSYEIYERNSNELLTELESGVIELALIRSSYPLPADFVELSSYTERLYAFWDSERLPLGAAEAVAPKELNGAPVCLPRGLSEAILDALRSCGAEPRVRAVCASRSMTLELARLTGAAALLSDSSAQRQNPSHSALSCAPLDMPGFSIKRSLVTVRGRELSLAARYFTDEFKR